MTTIKPTNPPTDDASSADPAAKPGTALRRARLLIAFALLLGVSVFAALAIHDLKNNTQADNPAPSDYGTSDRQPGGSAVTQENPILALAGLDPDKYTKIDHHPGRFAPFLGPDASISAPIQLPVVDGEAWEVCTYNSLNAKAPSAASATPSDAFAHYDRLARAKGLSLQFNNPTSAKTPGGLIASWSDGTRTLRLTAWPTSDPAPPPTPLRPRTPLKWEVKYSYPQQQP